MTTRSVRAPFEFRGHRLDEFQIQAIIALQQETATLVSAPTGTGKSLIADYLVDESLKSGRRVVYTAPIKALVNQKYRGFRAAFGAARTGIMTGDLSENADALLVVMTTEVLRNMLLHGGPNDGGPKGGGPKGGAPLPDWIVFDEIHYINHPERGTVWEEAILLLPKGVRILGLSATVPNIRELAAWLERALGEPVAAVVHDERAVPLRLYYFTDDGRALTHAEAWEHVTGGDLKGDALSVDAAAGGAGRSGGTGRYGGIERSGSAGRSGSTDRPGGAPGRSRPEAAPQTRHLDVISYVSRERLFPCIYFAFSRRECERMARDLARRRDFLRPHERDAVHVTVRQILQQTGLRPDDVPGLAAMRDMWQRGIGVHHAGLVPLVKHIVEHLLERRILRVVFATETFAVGVNMPVRTVCFDSVAKFDGRRRRLLTQQEFLQMAGRAGRRGLDKAGTVLIRTDPETMEAADWRDWEAASLEPITSRLSLSYTTVLNLIERFAGSGGTPPAGGPDAGPAAEAPTDPTAVPAAGPAPGPAAAPGSAADSRRCADAARPDAQAAGDISPAIREWLARSLFVSQSPQPGEALVELTTQFAEKAGQLRRLGYLTQEPGQAPQLTTKGAFCRGIWIKELLVTEMAFDGTLAEMDPAAMAGWAAAVVWESRPQDEQLPPAAPSWLAGVHLATDRIVRWTGSGARDKLRVEGRIAPVVSRWAAAADDALPEGPGRARTATGRSEKTPHEDVRDLAKFLRGYHLEPGDFVTLCRQTVDLLRQVASSADHVLRLADPRPADPSASERLRQVRDTARAAIAAIDRGVVAASRTF